jgi:hypothetical protein
MIPDTLLISTNLGFLVHEYMIVYVQYFLQVPILNGINMEHGPTVGPPRPKTI